MNLFSVRAIPTTRWSSSFPLNFRPQLLTLVNLCVGLTLFGLGEALMLASGFGVSPWLVLADGLATKLGLSIGMTTFVISLAVLLLWLPLRQMPGLGTLLNALIIALVIDLSLPYLPAPSSIALQGIESVSGILLIGLGSAMYLIAKLGPGPRDGLMTGLQRLTGRPIAVVRTAIEIAVLVTGWLLGGTLGLGTLLFAFGVGPALSVGLLLVLWVSKEIGSSDGVVE